MRNVVKQGFSWLLSGVLGAVGAYAYLHLQSAKTEKATIVRASRFELTDGTGRVVAFWGIDRGNNTVLAFLPKGGAGDVGPNGGLKSPAEPAGFTRQNPNEAFAVGLMSSQVPFMNLVGKDGNSRALLYLTDQQKPVLHMSDGRTEGRLMLGFVSSDAPSAGDDEWALLFRGPDVAGIGSLKDPANGKYRGYFSVAPNSKTTQQ
jgi:hypothetical protein